MHDIVHSLGGGGIPDRDRAELGSLEPFLPVNEGVYGGVGEGGSESEKLRRQGQYALKLYMIMYMYMPLYLHFYVRIDTSIYI